SMRWSRAASSARACCPRWKPAASPSNAASPRLTSSTAASPTPCCWKPTPKRGSGRRSCCSFVICSWSRPPLERAGVWRTNERKRFESLDVDRPAEDLADGVWDLVVPCDEFARCTVGRQMVRAADSIGANIAEGCGRGTYKENRQFARVGRGSLNETRHFLR